MKAVKKAEFELKLKRIRTGLYLQHDIKLNFSKYGLQNADVTRLLAAIDAAGIKNRITSLDLSDNRLTKLAINGFSALKNLNITGNGIAQFAYDALPSLEEFYAGYNKLYSLDFSNHASLKVLKVGNNFIHEVNLNNVSNLEKLALNNNYLKDLDISFLPKLHSVEIEHNPLVTLNISGSPISRMFIYNSDDLEPLSKIQAFNRRIANPSNSHDFVSFNVPPDNVVITSEQIEQYFNKAIVHFKTKHAPDILFENAKLYATLYLVHSGKLPEEIIMQTVLDAFAAKIGNYLTATMAALLGGDACQPYTARQDLLQSFANKFIPGQINKMLAQVEQNLKNSKALAAVVARLQQANSLTPRVKAEERIVKINMHVARIGIRKQFMGWASNKIGVPAAIKNKLPKKKKLVLIAS